MKKNLQSSEWVLVSSLMLIMASLVIVAKVNAYRAKALIETVPFDIEVPTVINVIVKGEVQEVAELRLEVGSRICDLQKKINLTPDADISFFRRRKRLKNGEIIVVPKKPLEQKSPHCL